MKITPRPITPSDKIDQSRDISGFNKWTQSSRTVSFILFVLGWFTIPAEVLMRRDFGQRWFAVVNFYAGLFLLLIVATVQYVWAALWSKLQWFIYDVVSSINPYYAKPERSLTDGLVDASMAFIVLAYVFLGSYHLFKIWWRNRTNTALHSFDDGTSRLELFAGWLMWVVNVLTVPFVWLYVLLLPRKQRRGKKVPWLMNDRTAFANTVFEPLLLLVLAYWVPGIASLWLFLSAIALAIHANWKETAKLSKILDFRDSMIDAQTMMELKDGTLPAKAPVRIMQQAAVTIKENPQVAERVTQQYPDLMSIIEEMNTDKSHLAN